MKKNMFNGIYVIGDSHARSFSYNSNFFPVFLGPGKKFNFTSDQNMNNLINATCKLLDYLDPEYALFAFGEADTRYYLGKGWSPWETSIDKIPDNFHLNIGKSIERYAKYLEAIEVYACNKIVLGIIPTVRPEQNQIAVCYNNELQKLSLRNNLLFINILDSVLDDNNKIKDEYSTDHVHASNRIQEIVEKYLIDKGILKTSGFDTCNTKSSEEIRKEFIFNESFGCYVFDGK